VILKMDKKGRKVVMVGSVAGPGARVGKPWEQGIRLARPMILGNWCPSLQRLPDIQDPMAPLGP